MGEMFDLIVAAPACVCAQPLLPGLSWQGLTNARTKIALALGFV